MSDLALLGVAVVYLLIGVFVFSVFTGDREYTGDGPLVFFITLWPAVLAVFAVVVVLCAVSWLGGRLHDLILWVIGGM